MGKVVVITGGSAGVGRAAAEAFARKGHPVGVIARGEERLALTVEALRRIGVKAHGVSADVADPDAVDRAADEIARALGPIRIWVNNAMATVLSPVSKIDPAEFRRVTDVTFLGTVHGTMTALRHMADRRGTIVNVGSALAYRSIPLQAAYCAAKHAVVGFTDALRSELLHDRVPVHLTAVHLPAVNTPQFDWSLNKLPRRMQPMAPIYQPEVAARAIVFAATHHRREIWVGLPTVKAILGQRVAPGLMDRFLARAAYDGQMADEPNTSRDGGNLFRPAPGGGGAHGRFDARSRPDSGEIFTSRHRTALGAGLAALGAMALKSLLAGLAAGPAPSRPLPRPAARSAVRPSTRTE